MSHTQASYRDMSGFPDYLRVMLLRLISVTTVLYTTPLTLLEVPNSYFVIKKFNFNRNRKRRRTTF